MAAKTKRPAARKTFLAKRSGKFSEFSYLIIFAAIPLVLTSLAYQSAFIYGRYLPWQDVIYPPGSPPNWQIARYIWINISLGAIPVAAVYAFMGKEKFPAFRAIIVAIIIGAVGMGLALLNHQLGINVWVPAMTLGYLIFIGYVWVKAIKKSR